MSFPSVARISLSGIQVEETRMAVSTANVANSETPGYTPGRVTSESLPGGGAAAIVRWSNGVAPSAPGTDAPSGTDLATERVDQLGALQGVRANVAVLRAADTVNRSLLDLIA